MYIDRKASAFWELFGHKIITWNPVSNLRTELKALTIFYYFKFSLLKEQYPVTAHVPNFDFLAGCSNSKDARRVRDP